MLKLCEDLNFHGTDYIISVSVADGQTLVVDVEQVRMGVFKREMMKLEKGGKGKGVSAWGWQEREGSGKVMADDNEIIGLGVGSEPDPSNQEPSGAGKGGSCVKLF